MRAMSHRSYGTRCAICGKFVGSIHSDAQQGLCTTCLPGVIAFQKAFGWSVKLASSALLYLEAHGSAQVEAQ